MSKNESQSWLGCVWKESNSDADTAGEVEADEADDGGLNEGKLPLTNMRRDLEAKQLQY